MNPGLLRSIIASAMALLASHASAAVTVTPSTLALATTEGATSPTGVLEFTAGDADVTGISACTFYDVAAQPISPEKISIVGDSLQGTTTITAFQTVPVTFACESTSVGAESVFYGCNSDSAGIFFGNVQCDVQPADPAQVTLTSAAAPGEISGFYLKGVLGDPDPTFQVEVQADEDLSGISCQYTDWQTQIPRTPTNISLTSPELPVTMTAGSSHTLDFICDNSLPGFDNNSYQCASDQGTFSLLAQCGVTSSDVFPWVVNLEGVRGNPAPVADVAFIAKNVSLEDISCTLFSDSGRAYLAPPGLPGSLPLGNAAIVTFGCDTTTAGEEMFANYSCATNQGQTNAFINCSVRERYVVEPWPESAQFTGQAMPGDPVPTTVVTMTADGVPVSGIQDCGFYDSPVATGFPVTPTLLSLQSGVVPTSLGATESVELTFACDASDGGYESKMYACASDQGGFAVPVVCDLQPPPAVIVSDPVPMTGNEGEPDPTAVGNWTTTTAMDVILCGFTYPDDPVSLITPERISLVDGTLPSPMPADLDIDLTFSCDASTAGTEEVLYGCGTSEGLFGMSVSCTIDSSGDYRFWRGWRLAIPDAAND